MSGVSLIFDLAVVALVAGISGLACRRVNLSAVVGYLLAGIVIGPYTPPFQFVQDGERVRMLADLGLVFLVFGIGLSFSINRMQRLGGAQILATAVGALLVLASCRLFCSLIGLNDQQGLFVAAVLMVSSSAVISKVLEENASNHTRWGQLALGVTLLEDIVAIVMLTLLSSLTNIGGEGEAASLWKTITSFTGFVALLFLGVLLLVPRLLRVLKNTASSELIMLLVTGLLLALGWIAVRLGYSMALTAFILGAIIGSTPHRPEIDRLFEGMRHLFGAIFFVAMGMMFDLTKLGDVWMPVGALALAAFFLRIPALALALAVVGNGLKDSIRAALTLTPLGEFSFVIAYLGVQSGVMPDSFYPLALGASLLTCLVSPALIRRAEPASERLEAMIPARAKRAIRSYHDWLDRLHHARAQSVAWRLMAPRIGQTIAQLFVVAGCLAIASALYRPIQRAGLFDMMGFEFGTTLVVVGITGLMILPPLVAVWRNISALSMIAAEAMTGGRESFRARRIVHRAFTAAAVSFAALWLAALLPTDLLPTQVLLAVLLVLMLVSILTWRNLIRWHSRIEIRLHEELVVARAEGDAESRGWSVSDLSDDADWNLQVQEVNIPMNTCHAGLRLIDLRLRQEMGCSVVGIDRQGFAINNPSGNDRVFPGDRLLLLGTREALAKAASFLIRGAERLGWMQQFDELGTESVTVPPGSSCAGQSMKDLDLIGRFGVQVGGIRRRGQEIVAPAGGDVIQPGDQLLLLGTPNAINQFTQSM